VALAPPSSRPSAVAVSTAGAPPTTRVGVMAHVARRRLVPERGQDAPAQREVHHRGRGRRSARGNLGRFPRAVPGRTWPRTSSCSPTPATTTSATRRSPISSAASARLTWRYRASINRCTAASAGRCPDPVQILCAMIADLRQAERRPERARPLRQGGAPPAASSSRASGSCRCRRPSSRRDAGMLPRRAAVGASPQFSPARAHVDAAPRSP